MREQILQMIEQEKLIVIVRGVPSDKLIPIAEAMYAGGVRLLEITFDATGKVSSEDTAMNIAALVSHFGNRMAIGAGTVLTPQQVELTHQAGGQFIISPDANPDVIHRTRELEMISMPGALTPNEIQKAHLDGADFVKIFPMTSMGPEYIKAIKAPLSHIKMMAVGGINLSNIPDYLKVGICGFGIGSNITDKKLIDTENYAGLQQLAENYVKVIKGSV